MTTQLVPKRRFKGFEGSWKIIKLMDLRREDDVYSFTGGPFGSDLKVEDYTFEGIRIIQLQNIGDGYFNNEYKIYTSEKKARELSSNLIYPGDIIIAKMAEPLARAAIIPKVEDVYLMSSDGIRLSIDKEKYFIHFVLHAINHKKFRRKAIENSTGTTRKRIGLTTLGNLELSIPDFKEQQKIGEFFKLLDARITNQKRKIEKIKAIKQAYLTEMFPREGEDTPKRRFEGFSEPWIKMKLANIVIKGGSGGTPLTSNPGYYNGGIPFLGISDITNSQGKIYETEKTITEEGLNSSAAWIVPKGAISLAMYASVGKVAILKIDSATSQAFYNLIIEKKETRDYVYHYLTKMELEGLWSKDISVGTQANLNAEKVKNLNIPMPKELKEREKVADFLTNLDDLLRIEKNKMSKLKKMKAAFLEEMFV